MASARVSACGRASCGPSFFVAGGGREGHWSGVRVHTSIYRKRLLQSTLCGYSRSIAHISVWACLACVPDAEARGSIEERRGCPDALGARGRPLLLRAALGMPLSHASVCTQHQGARSQAQEGAPLLAGCARLTLPWGQHARVCDGSIVRVDFHPRRGLRRLGHVTMSRECDCERSCGLVMLHRVLLLARRRRWGVSARGAVFAFPGTRGFGRSRRPAGKLTTRRKRTVSFIGCSSPPRHRSGAEGEFRSCESGTRGPGLMTP